MIIVVEQNIATELSEIRDIMSQAQTRVAKFDCSWEEYINSYITGNALIGIGLGKEQKYSGYSFSKTVKPMNLKYDINEGTLFCVLAGYISLYRFAILVGEL